MTLRAELHDGRVLEFPDGTDPSVVQRVVKQQLAATPKKGVDWRDIGESAVQGLVDSVRGTSEGAISAMLPGGKFTADAVINTANTARNALMDFVHAPGQLTTNRPYAPKTESGKVAYTAGQMAPNALAPGSALQRAANVVVPTVTTELAGRGAKALGADERGQQLARAAGGIAGGLAANARVSPRAPIDSPVAAVSRGQDAAAMAARAGEYRAAGIEPALVDLVDDSGRAVVRAAASRMTPGRQAATDYADGRSMDLPARVSEQSRRIVSPDPRTPDQIRQATADARATNADSAFSAVRDEQIQMPPETVQALRNPLGRDAIAEAARRERNPEVRAALNRLSTDALDAPGTPISIGMADRISRTLFGRAQAASRAGDNDLAATFTQLGNAVRNPARTASPGYGEALEGYAADSRLNEAAGVGEALTSRNTDEFAQQATALSPEERVLALASGRRAIERKVGENPGSAPGVVRQLADAPEQQARNNALMGQERATRFQDALRLEGRAVRNASDIAPRFGSQTQNKAQDAAQVAGRVVQGGRALGGDVHAMIGLGLDFLRSRGMNDAQAEKIVAQALSRDPAAVNRALGQINARYGPEAVRGFRRLNLSSSTVRALTGGASSAQQPRRP